MALTISDVKNIIIVQNKIDLVSEEDATKNYEQIKEFVAGTIAENAPIIPICAHHEENIDVLLAAIDDFIPSPEVDETKSTRMYVARSFDVNTPGNRPEDIVGGVIGGTISSGILHVGDEIEVRPGTRVEIKGKSTWAPIVTIVESLYAGGRPLKEVKPGGLIAIGTMLDPSLTKSDALIGRVAGEPGALPEVLHSFSMKVTLLDRVVGSTQEEEVENLKTNEPLMLSIGTATTVGIISSARQEMADVKLKLPVTAESDQRVAISRRISGRWRLIGYGIIQ
jgi:translation initiation factor 2 subunit 3